MKNFSITFCLDVEKKPFSSHYKIVIIRSVRVKTVIFLFLVRKFPELNKENKIAHFKCFELATEMLHDMTLLSLIIRSMHKVGRFYHVWIVSELYHSNELSHLLNFSFGNSVVKFRPKPVAFTKFIVFFETFVCQICSGKLRFMSFSVA